MPACEARRHGGSNWLDYDLVFRQQAVLDPSLRWNTMHPGIQATTLVGRTASSTLLCGIQTTLQGSVSALSYLQPPLGPPILLVRQFGRLALGLLSDIGLESLANICVSWNKWRCTFPCMCRFSHVCATCIWLEIVQHPPLTRSTILWVVAGTQPLVPSRDHSFDVAV